MFFTSRYCRKIFYFPLKIADLIKLRRLVKRRHAHVGAPDNRIEALYKEFVLTPRGRDMNPELGPVVAASPERKLSYLWVLSNVILVLVIEEHAIGCCPRGTSQEFTCQSIKFRWCTDSSDIFLYPIPKPKKFQQLYIHNI